MQLEAEAKKMELKAKSVIHYRDFVDRLIAALRQQFQAGRLSFGGLGQAMAAGTDKLLDFVDSVDVVNKTLSLRLPITPDAAAEMGYRDMQEVLDIERGRVEGGEEADEDDELDDGAQED